MANLCMIAFLVFQLIFPPLIHCCQDKCDAPDSLDFVEGELIMAQTVRKFKIKHIMAQANGFFRFFFNSLNIPKVCRHGDRNIMFPYGPMDKWKSEKYWTGGFSELTNVI